MTWILNLPGEDAILASSAFWSWSALVVFPEEGKPENMTSGIDYRAWVRLKVSVEENQWRKVEVGDRTSKLDVIEMRRFSAPRSVPRDGPVFKVLYFKFQAILQFIVPEHYNRHWAKL